MLTRNFDNIVNGIVTGYVAANSAEYTENGWLKGIPSVVKMPSGSFYACASNILFSSGGLLGGASDQAINTTAYSQPVLLVGSDDKEENYNDYTIATITKLTVPTSRGNAYKTENGVHRLVATKTFVNNTETDITVKEIGMFALVYVRSASSSSTSVSYPLIAREKLATPVTIPANGGVATFTMNITIPVVDNSAS